MIEIQPHQKTAVKHLLKKCIKQTGLMVFWRMGTGKTIGTWNVIFQYAEKVNPLKVLIVCNEQLVSVWEVEKEKLQMKVSLDIEYMTYKDFLKKSIKKKTSNSFLVIDEVHNVLPYLEDGKKNYTDTFYHNCRQFEKKMFLSGTPVIDSAFDILHYINACADKCIFPTNEILFNKQFKTKKYVHGTTLVLVKFLLDIWSITTHKFVIIAQQVKQIKLQLQALYNQNVENLELLKQTPRFSNQVDINKLKAAIKYMDDLKTKFKLFIQAIELYINFGSFANRFNVALMDLIIKYLESINYDKDIINNLEDMKEVISSLLISILQLAIQKLFINRFYINKERVHEYYNLNKKKVVKFSQKYVSYVDIPDNLKLRFPAITEKTVTHKYTVQQMDLFLKYIKGNLNPTDCEMLDISIPEYYNINFQKVLHENESIYKHGLKLGNMYENPKFKFILDNIKSNKNKKIAIYSNFVKAGGLLFSQFLTDNKIDHIYLENNDDISQFNEGDVNVIILHPKFSEGLSLRNVRYYHILEIPEALGKYEQVKARVNRLDSHSSLQNDDRNCIIFTHVMKSEMLLRKMLGFKKWITDNDYWKSVFYDQHLHSVHEFGRTPDQIVHTNVSTSRKFRDSILGTIKKFTIENMTEKEYLENCSD